MNEKFVKVHEALEKKNSKEDSGVIAKLQAEIKKLQKIRLADQPSCSSAIPEDGTAKRLRELEDFKRRSQEEADRKVAALDEQVAILRRLHEHTTTKAATWKEQAMRPGNKRGSIILEEAPSVRTRVRPRCTPSKTPATATLCDAEAGELIDVHRKEVEFLKELRSRDLNGRRVAEQKLERVKEGKQAAELEIERLKAELDRANMEKTKSNLKTKLDKVANNQRVDKGKRPASSSKQVVRANDKEGFMADARKALRKMNMDGVKAICAQEGVVYTALERTKEAIATHRAAKAFESASKQATIQEVSEDTGTSIDIAKGGDDEGNS
ncbi:hypothetical protein CBR_g49199 [Chara braunii]|uniref:Uncharacterized protein n=1 Tax=Chara braunii TaxID=69332 RepID=A0A388M4K6_CHABU|nr:hypothetical protein CBR_g49199 [Chara braunii]|eukprot:GBG89409.1 hypothetical protein CBR_g49199 [Chara braunii]